jgi:hypothetical protein
VAEIGNSLRETLTGFSLLNDAACRFGTKFHPLGRKADIEGVQVGRRECKMMLTALVETY